MSQPFDPYHAWLGIAPAEQPAHHYRLLGLAPFEGNATVIRNGDGQGNVLLEGAPTLP